MARARNIKPGFFKNDRLADCSPLARLLFAGLWCEADREGRLEDRPRRLKAEYLAYDDCDIDDLLDQLERGGFIARYQVGESRYIAVIMFGKHQNPHVREPASQIPAPDEHSAGPVQDSDGHSSGPADSPSLIPDSKELPPTAAQQAAPTEPEEPPAPTEKPSRGDGLAVEPDPIFGHGLAFLIGKGVKERGARSFLGAMRKELGELVAAELLAKAEAEDVSDPIPWLRMAGETRKKQRGPPTKPSVAARFDDTHYEGTPDDELPSYLRAANG